MFTIFTDEVDKYFDALFKLGILRVDELKTVWQKFSEASPGGRMTIKHNGIDIYEMVKQLTEKGLYLRERLEE